MTTDAARDGYVHAAFPVMEGPYGSLGSIDDRKAFEDVMRQTSQNWADPRFVAADMALSLQIDLDVAREDLTARIEAAELATAALTSLLDLNVS